MATGTNPKANNTRGVTIHRSAANSEMPSTEVQSGMAFLSSCGVESKCLAIVSVYLSHSSDPGNERLIRNTVGHNVYTS